MGKIERIARLLGETPPAPVATERGARRVRKNLHRRAVAAGVLGSRKHNPERQRSKFDYELRKLKRAESNVTSSELAQRCRKLQRIVARCDDEKRFEMLDDWIEQTWQKRGETLEQHVQRARRSGRQAQRTEFYEAYLRSPAWAAKRKLVLERDGNRCARCSSIDQLHVHHLSYRHLGNEELKELVTLCCDCHGLVHGRKLRFS